MENVLLTEYPIQKYDTYSGTVLVIQSTIDELFLATSLMFPRRGWRPYSLYSVAQKLDGSPISVSSCRGIAHLYSVLRILRIIIPYSTW